MKHVWWSITGTCQKCGAELLKCLVMFSSDGELRFLLECDKCKIILNWRVFASALAEKARDNDIARCHTSPVIPVSRRLTPPLAIPPEKIMKRKKKMILILFEIIIKKVIKAK